MKRVFKRATTAGCSYHYAYYVNQRLSIARTAASPLNITNMTRASLCKQITVIKSTIKIIWNGFGRLSYLFPASAMIDHITVTQKSLMGLSFLLNRVQTPEHGVPGLPSCGPSWFFLCCPSSCALPF